MIIKRPLTTEDKEMMSSLKLGNTFQSRTLLGMDNGETGIKMALSTWSYMILEPPLPRTAYVYPPIAAVLVIGVEFWIYTKFRNNRNGRKK